MHAFVFSRVTTFGPLSVVSAVALAMLSVTSWSQEPGCHTDAACPVAAILPASCVEPAADEPDALMHTAQVRILRGSIDDMLKLLSGTEDEQLQKLCDQISTGKLAMDSSNPSATVDRLLENARSAGKFAMDPSIPSATVERLLERAREGSVEVLVAPRINCLDGQQGEVAMGTAPPHPLESQPECPPPPKGQTGFPAHASLSLSLRPQLCSTEDGSSRLNVEASFQLSGWRETVLGGKPVHPVQTDPTLLDFETRRVRTGFHSEPGCWCCLLVKNKSSFPFEPVDVQSFDDADNPGAEPWKEKSLTLVLIQVEVRGED